MRLTGDGRKQQAVLSDINHSGGWRSVSRPAVQSICRVALASAASFHAHVLIDKEYHVEGSRLEHFAWFRRKRLHVAHHLLHANSNFAVITFPHG